MSSFMSISNTEKKSEAYKLIYDPTRLFHLLYTKYGDIEEDYNDLITNQLIYNKCTHINSLFKDNNYQDDKREFLRRKYKKNECSKRIPKLYDYYKNYYKFYCQPFFLNAYYSKLIWSYQTGRYDFCNERSASNARIYLPISLR